MLHAHKAYLAAKIIYAKMKNQLNLIKYFHKYHKESRGLASKFDTASAKINNLVEIIRGTESYTGNYAEVLMGYESQAAVVYWDYIRQLLADDNVEFEARIRKGATDILNSLLNYGYSILYARVWQAVLSAKLNPSAGFLHAGQPGKPVLVFDLIELFRAQAVDRIVIGLVQKGEPLSMEKNLLSDDTKQLLIRNILERLHRYENYRSRSEKFIRIISEQVSDMAAYIAGEKKSFKPYIAKW